LVPVIDIHDIHLTVKDVITFNGQHTQALYTDYTTLPQPVADTINNFHTNFNVNIDDVFIWSHNKNGVYSTKSGYSWILSVMEPTNNIIPHYSWSWIWKLQVPEKKKNKFFIWLAYHDAVPTLSLLHHRHIAISATCGRCGEEEESFMHCVRDSRFSNPIWRKFGFSDTDFYTSICAHDWIKGNAKGPRAIIFLACLWWIWRHRNQMCFSSNACSPIQLCNNIQNSAAIIQKIFQPAAISSNSDRLVRWNSSNCSCYILNVDGSCLGTPIQAGFGGLIRRNVGFFLSGFFGFLKDSTCILLAELTTIHNGLRLALEMGLDEVVCYSDSLLSVNIISEDVSKFHTCTVLVQDIKDIFATHNYNVQHTLREGNHYADFMAKQGASSNIEFYAHPSPPHDLIDMLRNDAMGVYFQRA